MSSLYFMTIICDRNQTRRFLAFYKEHGVSVTFQALGRGTAGFGDPGLLWAGGL